MVRVFHRLVQFVFLSCNYTCSSFSFLFYHSFIHSYINIILLMLLCPLPGSFPSVCLIYFYIYVYILYCLLPRCILLSVFIAWNMCVCSYFSKEKTRKKTKITSAKNITKIQSNSEIHTYYNIKYNGSLC